MPNLTRFQIGELPLELGSGVYVVPPPDSVRGIMMTRIATLGLNAAIRPDQLTDDSVMQIMGQEALDNLMNDKDLGIERLCLTTEVLEQMQKDKVPLNDIQMAARYVCLYFVFDKKTAERALEDELSERNGMQTSPTDVELPKPSRSGQDTASQEPNEPTVPSADMSYLHT